MKKQLMRFMHTIIPIKFFKAAAIVLILSGAQYVNAQSIAVSATAERAEPGAPDAVITHIYSNTEKSLFGVKIDNASGEKFKLIIKEADGTVLFQSVYSDRNFVKTYSVPRPESDNLVFVIKGLTGNTTQTFEVNSSSHYVEDVVIKKVI